MSGVAAIGRRPWLSRALFRFTKWGNPFADERFSWPYPMYDRMRADGPIAYGRPYRQWFVFGYDEVQEVFRSPHTATAPIGELLLSTSQYRKLSPSARVELLDVAARQRRTGPHPTALGGEQSLHASPDRSVRTTRRAGGRRAGGHARHDERDRHRRSVHDQDADRGDQRRARTACRSSALAAERLTGDRRDAGAADPVRPGIDEPTLRRAGHLLPGRDRSTSRRTRR